MRTNLITPIIISISLLTLLLVPVHAQGKGAGGESTMNLERTKGPLKITYEIYSGRVSPYFEVTSPEETSEILKRLHELPLVTPTKDYGNWQGCYMFQLPDKNSSELHLITVGRVDIAIQQGKSSVVCADKYSLYKYLDELRIKHGLTSGDNLPIKQ